MSKRICRRGLYLLLAFFLGTGVPLSLCGQTVVANALVTADGQGVFATGHYRNRFREQGYSEAQVQNRLQAAFQQAGYGDIYTLDGQSREPTHAPGLVADNATAGLAATDSRRPQPFYEALWNAPLPSGQFRYYDGMLWMLSSLHVSGQFRIWTPAWVAEDKVRVRHAY